MRSTLLSILLLAGLVAADATGPATLASQTVLTQSGERGWVGISYDFRQTSDGGVTVLVTDVSEGSPAQRAGIAVGDELISLNGQSAQRNFDNLPLRIRPGDAVQVVLSRSGRQQQVRLVAAQRPPDFRSGASITLTMTADSMEESMFRAMDSLRLTLVTPEGQEVRVLGMRGSRESHIIVGSEPGETRLFPEARSLGTVEAPMRFSFRTDETVEELALDEVRAPFGFFVFRTEGRDSLLRAMERFNREVRELRIREADRLPLLVDESGRLRRDHADDELVGLSETLKSYVDRSVVLRQAIDRATREASEPRTGYVSWRVSNDTGGDETRSTVFGPLTPYALGQNRAAGAEVVDLNPELADYFQVAGGVLVVDVLPRTPAAIAGIQPGDVITHIDRVTIRSLQELRVGLVRADESVPITVVRRGDAVQLLLHR